MIKDFEPRLYQQTILATAALKNTLVVLPTGMGKTNIFVMLAAQRLKQYPTSKILLVGPTRPLIDQYRRVFESTFDISPDKLITFTGNVNPEKRQMLWNAGTIFFSTPQGLENDIITNRINLKEVSLFGFDEAHRAVGDYSYVWIAKKYLETARYPRTIGMTASPGADTEKILEVCKNLAIEDIEVRTDDDPDVRPYVQEIDIAWVYVEFSEDLKKIHKYLSECYVSKLKDLKQRGYVKDVDNLSKKELLGIQAAMRSDLASQPHDFDVMRALSICAEAMKVQHAVELIETQGVEPLYKYLSELQNESYTTKTKAVINLVRDINFRSGLILAEEALKKGIIHPKITRLKEIMEDIISKIPDAKIIIFNQYRDSATAIIDALKTLPNIKPQLFVGQQKKGATGLSQKEQMQILESFKNGEFNTLVMTSVGEEGLDIPKVDHVIFYEPVPSAIRSIQRRGRTGRHDKGNVTILVTKGTRDEIYRWSAHHKEKKMYRILKDLRTTFHKTTTLRQQPSLTSFIDDKPVIYVDNREKGNDIPKRLVDLQVDVKLAQLKTADYIISSRSGVEFKTVHDFVESLVDGRLLPQLVSLAQNFDRPLLIVQGKESIYEVRNIHPHALRGLLASITVDFRIPIIFTKDSSETSEMLLTLARREQQERRNDVPLHPAKPQSQRELQEFVIASLPHVGPRLARELLEAKGSIKNIINASEEDLMSVESIGKNISKKIHMLVNEPYKKES